MVVMRRLLAVLLCAALLAPDFARAGGGTTRAGGQSAGQTGTPGAPGAPAPIDLRLDQLSGMAPLTPLLAPGSLAPMAGGPSLVLPDASVAVSPVTPQAQDVPGSAAPREIPEAPLPMDHRGIRRMIRVSAEPAPAAQAAPAEAAAEQGSALGQLGAILGSQDHAVLEDRLRRYFDLSRALDRTSVLAEPAPAGAAAADPARAVLARAARGERASEASRQIMRWRYATDRYRALGALSIGEMAALAGMLLGAVVGAAWLPSAGIAVLLSALAAFLVLRFLPVARERIAKARAAREKRRREALLKAAVQELAAGGDGAIAAVETLGRMASEDATTFQEHGVIVAVMGAALNGSRRPSPALRRALVAELEALARANIQKRQGQWEHITQSIVDALGAHINSVAGASGVRGRFGDLDSHWPSFLDFRALSAYFSDVRTGDAVAALAAISPGARIALEVDAYDRLRRGEDPDKARARMLSAAARYAAREARLKAWKPTVGIEIEVLERTLDAGGKSAVSAGFESYAWGTSAHEFARLFGIRTASEQMIEYSPDPAFEWRVLDEMIRAFRRAELMPMAFGDHAKLHITLVHARPSGINYNDDDWRERARLIALLEGVLTASERRLEEARAHLTSFRREEFKNAEDFKNIAGIPAGSIRAEYLAGSVEVDPMRDGSRTEPDHTRALRLVDTLHTALYAHMMRKGDAKKPMGRAGIQTITRFAAEDLDRKERLAALYDEFHRWIEGILTRHGYIDLIDMMGDYSQSFRRQGDFLVIRRDTEAMRELEAAVNRYIPLMDRLIDEIASRPATTGAGGDASGAPR